MAEAPSASFDPDGLATVHEVPKHSRPSYDADLAIERLSQQAGRPSHSHEASVNSSFARSYSDKDMAADPPPVPYTLTSTRNSQQTQRLSDNKLKKADRRRTVGSQLEPTESTQRPRRSGLRNTIRRMFGRKGRKDQSSRPMTTVYHPHNPDEFITSATDVEDKPTKMERSASLPSNAFIRSSGLSSHPPFQPPALPYDSEKSTPPSKARDIKEPPQRPRRPSAPNNSFTKEDLQAVTDAMSGIGFQGGDHQNMDTQDIGFAVTNGSHPKRRSRSVGAYRDSNHRMSPIQWRQHRTKSDDFSYYRGSVALVEKAEAEPRAIDKPDEPRPSTVEAPEGDFNFELQDGDLEGQEKIGLEERLVTLEIKLMDLEYLLSRVQAGSTISTIQEAKSGHKRQDSVETYTSSGAQSSVPNNSVRGQPQSLSPSSSSIFRAEDQTRNGRPNSIATTLKPTPNLQANSFRNSVVDYSKRSSLSGLTIEHYSTLVTLVRHEQAARVRLEEQVTQLQHKIDSFLTSDHSERRSPGHPFSGHNRNVSSTSHISRRFGIVNPDVRRGGRYYNENRPRSSSYSTNETDTEDDYHDAYLTPKTVTPVERGEFERGAFNKLPGVEDGEAF